MIVVADTTVLNYLILTGCAHLLSDLFGGVILPGAVQAELTHPKAPDAVRNWMQQPPAWLEVRSVESLLTLPGLHRGEQEAISLVVSLGADALLIDERRGSRAAMEHGISILGTLAILEEAAHRDLILLPEAIEKLKQTNFHITEQAIEAVLERYTQRQRARRSPGVPELSAPADSSLVSEQEPL